MNTPLSALALPLNIDTIIEDLPFIVGADKVEAMHHYTELRKQGAEFMSEYKNIQTDLEYLNNLVRDGFEAVKNTESVKKLLSVAHTAGEHEKVYSEIRLRLQELAMEQKAEVFGKYKDLKGSLSLMQYLRESGDTMKAEADAAFRDADVAAINAGLGAMVEERKKAHAEKTKKNNAKKK